MSLRRATPEPPAAEARTPEPRTESAQLDAVTPFDEGAELPPGVEPWSGEEMPAGSASSHSLQASLEQQALSDGEEGPELPHSLPPEQEPLAADELNYRHLYETRFRDLDQGERETLARKASGNELFAWCVDPAPRVIAALLENPQFGLAHARAVAHHHQNDSGLEILARRAQLLRDSHVQRRLMQNMHTPDVVLERVLRSKRLLDVYRLSVDRDLPERNRTRVRTRLRPTFTRAEPEDRAALIIKTEGRCLNNLAGCTFDARTTQILCNLSTYSVLFIQNLARFSATPPQLIAKLLRSPSVQRQPQLRAMLVRHPNAGSDAKRKG